MLVHILISLVNKRTHWQSRLFGLSVGTGMGNEAVGKTGNEN